MLEIIVIGFGIVIAAAFAIKVMLAVGFWVYLFYCSVYDSRKRKKAKTTRKRAAMKFD